ncbi:ferredoxin [Cryptosporangium phraense]|uniref:Ferredoxin n=1 Tax=Cryptosporangium phraense TaxID=2593070 RepID=A0A545APZ1_9ACTN|nr:ferredoxin [Cryptosporangium phraense]TQS43331.1 ferredoxin [Cryptosporangium phraense]
MKAHVDDEACRGHGICWTICPEVFTLTDDGYAVAAPGGVPPELEAAVKSAVGSCPEHAIST